MTDHASLPPVIRAAWVNRSQADAFRSLHVRDRSMVAASDTRPLRRSSRQRLLS